MPRRTIFLFAGACFAIAIALAILTAIVVTGRGRSQEASQPVASTGQPQVGGPFQLVDQNGRAVDQTLLNGKWSLVFFGFTGCPDFCPTTLTSLKTTRDRLGARGKDVQVVFISVDPERDTSRALKDYLASDGFPEGAIGLTGTPARVRAAADAYRAYYEKVGTGPDYSMNHSLTVYLMGPDGKFRTAIANDLGPDRSARVIANAMARG